MKDKIKEYIYAHKDELIYILSELVSIQSVKGRPEENAPFGREPRRALERMDRFCSEAGFLTDITENAVGSADLSPNGEFPKLGILCHLDVVPAAAENWHTDPFKVAEKDGKLFGRGVIDDKGPLAASFIAMKCIKELGISLRSGVRLIYGTDEENGSGDLEIYLKKKKLPECVFTPDASFPLINIEKGMMRSRFSGKYDEEQGNVLCFSGGSIPNAVPDRASCVIKGIDEGVIRKAIVCDKSGARFEIKRNEEALTVICTGRSAHASTPESGINSVTALLSLLSRLPLKEGKQKDIITGLSKAFPFGETDGASIGLKASDERSGALTLAFSIFKMEKGSCEGCIDVRFPTCLSLREVESAERSALADAGLMFDGYMGDEPHCVDENSDFIRKLLKVYEDVTGEQGKCIAIGGGTYVHNIEGGVAFGVERGQTDYHMHGADEFITVEELLDDAVIFAQAILEICGE